MPHRKSSLWSQPVHRLDNLVDRETGLQEHTCFPVEDGFEEAAFGDADARFARGHRFDGRHSEILVDRNVDRGDSLADEPMQVYFRDPTEECDVLSIAAERLEPVELIPRLRA
jgi:hypothetical protein